jgi:uncharacterized damage-inducible protein DinB
MSFAAELLPEFDREMATTRRLLERVPDRQGEWKPHPKSFCLGHLALLVAWMPGWITNAARESTLDLAKAPGYSIEPTAKLLALFDTNVREARKALAGTSDADLAATWTLTRGDAVFMSMPKREVIRLHLDHLIHHRGQLTVYLRLRDVPLPPIYGPTADERGM